MRTVSWMLGLFIVPWLLPSWASWVCDTASFPARRGGGARASQTSHLVGICVVFQTWRFIMGIASGLLQRSIQLVETGPILVQ